MKSKIFLDSDVIISSLISSTGAASLLCGLNLSLHITNISQKELQIVIERLNLDKNKFEELIQNLSIVTINNHLNQIKEEFAKYTTDENDAHIIAGATAAKAKFLITYNLKHYEIENIKRNLNIIILTPAQLLQYLRSQS